ncbi:hypothetical protein WJX84_009067 [Apatococcus fuscideae]
MPAIGAELAGLTKPVQGKQGKGTATSTLEGLVSADAKAGAVAAAPAAEPKAAVGATAPKPAAAKAAKGGAVPSEPRTRSWIQLTGPTDSIISSLPLDISREPALPPGKPAAAAAATAQPSKAGAKKVGLDEAPPGPKVVLQGSWELPISVGIREWLQWPLGITIMKVLVPEPGPSPAAQQPEARTMELARGVSTLAALLDGITNAISQEVVLGGTGTASEVAWAIRLQASVQGVPVTSADTHKSVRPPHETLRQ